MLGISFTITIATLLTINIVPGGINDGIPNLIVIIAFIYPMQGT